CGQGTDVPWTF
nr:immunoglobulin light chain junction region [Macaca mulatta]MOX97878.1 immunoglobulin light chain junction region [Macaca mulatta]MOY02104.1 immunoglobulin light chain junction region [Macaca mulatta]